MKCDEGRPTCSMCKASKVECGGYAKSLFFDCDDNDAEEAQRYRRPLFSEDERRQMSDELIQHMPPSRVGAYLTEIDEAMEGSCSENYQTCRGPFSAFRPMADNAISVDEQDDCSPPSVQSIYQLTSLLSPTEGLGFSNDDEHPAEPEPGRQSPSVADNRPQASTESANSVYDIFHDLQMADFLNEEATENIFDMFIPEVDNDAPSRSSPYPPTQCIPQQVETPVPHNAVYLLKHYSNTVLGLLTPFRHGKTPWHILFLPHSKSTLAALTLGERIDHASLGAFYGTLAISALSLGGIFNSGRWQEEGQSYVKMATDQTQQMLNAAYTVTKTAKYKSILIALLTMLQISILTNNRDQTEFYFLEVEKFIRLRGLRRNKSRKVRLLHHCYSFERLLYESTLVASETSSQRTHVRKAVECSDAAPYSLDSLSFGLSNWANLDQELLKVKNKEEGENDLHLHIPGIWASTLYPEIFGLPELYLFLISLIVRLGKEKDRSERNNVHSIGLKEFMEQARAIERCIDQLQWVDLPAGDGQEQAGQTVSNFVNAMQHALGIYFYRRIYDLDASLLQQKVLAVRDCLRRFEAAGDDSSFGYSRFIWPAFIAASEAEDPDVQASFAAWFQSSTERSGLQIFRDKLADVEQVWEERRRRNGGRVSWLDIVRRKSSRTKNAGESPVALISTC